MSGQIRSELGLLSISKTCKRRSYCQVTNYHPPPHHLFWRKTSEGNLGRNFKASGIKSLSEIPPAKKHLNLRQFHHLVDAQLSSSWTKPSSSWRDPGCHYHCTASLQQRLGLVYIHPYLKRQQIKWLTNCKHNKSCSWKQLRYCV